MIAPFGPGAVVPATWPVSAPLTVGSTSRNTTASPSEIYTAPKSWTERAFPKLLHYGRMPKGCHFAAWEQPKYFTDEVRATFKSLRA